MKNDAEPSAAFDEDMRISREEATEGLKVRINELLYHTLPEACTLRDMERIAVTTFAAIMEQWDKEKKDG